MNEEVTKVTTETTNEEVERLKKELEDRKRRSKRNNRIALVILLIGIIVALIILLKGCNGGSDDIATVNPGNIAIAEGDDISKIPQKEDVNYEESIELPYLSTATVSDTYNIVPLQNPEGNTVYMAFTVSYNNEIIYTSDGAVAPGEYVAWYPKETFTDAGEYDVVINIANYDSVDYSDCSSANIECHLTVQ